MAVLNHGLRPDIPTDTPLCKYLQLLKNVLVLFYYDFAAGKCLAFWFYMFWQLLGSCLSRAGPKTPNLVLTFLKFCCT